jgi:hypothetical protein
MVPRYPGNNPENGPAIKWCSKCDLEIEPCGYCELCFHEGMRPTPGQTWEHNSWGHGDPEVDVGPAMWEPDAAMAAEDSDVAAMEAEYQRRDALGLCIICAERGEHTIMEVDGSTHLYCNQHYREAMDDMVRTAERCAGWDPNP